MPRVAQPTFDKTIKKVHKLLSGGKPVTTAELSNELFPDMAEYKLRNNKAMALTQKLERWGWVRRTPNGWRSTPEFAKAAKKADGKAKPTKPGKVKAAA
jgi:hypothetical protein